MNTPRYSSEITDQITANRIRQDIETNGHLSTSTQLKYLHFLAQYTTQLEEENERLRKSLDEYKANIQQMAKSLL